MIALHIFVIYHVTAPPSTPPPSIPPSLYVQFRQVLYIRPISCSQLGLCILGL